MTDETVLKIRANTPPVTVVACGAVKQFVTGRVGLVHLSDLLGGDEFALADRATVHHRCQLCGELLNGAIQPTWGVQ